MTKHYRLFHDVRSHFCDVREVKQTTVKSTLLNRMFNEQAIAGHVRYKFLYVSLPSSAKQQHEITKFWAVYGT